ncbi:sugar phosphate isomerase/epimerase family protein [Spirosoma endbachense]|uniref:Sugar phosphate isomerase/epimerase n=1 Tax=Spirosoma endbachense TaxID=2666025 RepID=A0A6P1W6E7_9BACT|nr:sugar phosphate isomerase/epimerase [Spirosoma endbachense]QHW00139.1 sugar phosphate isomerase/epimerase [Spirosoma endbachense]
MNFHFFCPRWGQEQMPWKEFLRLVKAAGYQGVEAGLPVENSERDILLNELAKLGLQFIGQHWETVCSDFDQYYSEFEKRLLALAAARPLFINTQTGKDYYSVSQNEKLIALADSIAAQTNVPIIHETHRGKFSFAAHITRMYLDRLPNLRITLDISHWFNTAETFLHDQPEAVALAISRTDHIHCRVGHTEGPQISDPRAPEWQEAVQQHLDIWDRVVALHRQNDRSICTFTPEFGAPPYMFLQPYTRQPVVNQWEVNQYMMEFLRKRYENFTNL